MVGPRRYELVLRPKADVLQGTSRRYIYLFSINSHGASTLLFPRRGSVENRFPIDAAGRSAMRDVPLGYVDVEPPFGVDTFVLLSSDEALPNPSVLAWSGVRTRGPRGETAFEELLSRTGGSLRSASPVLVPTTWSIDRLIVESAASR
jgi:hypothetical protein